MVRIISWIIYCAVVVGLFVGAYVRPTTTALVTTKALEKNHLIDGKDIISIPSKLDPVEGRYLRRPMPSKTPISASDVSRVPSLTLTSGLLGILVAVDRKKNPSVNADSEVLLCSVKKAEKRPMGSYKVSALLCSLDNSDDCIAIISIPLQKVAETVSSQGSDIEIGLGECK
jgi:hypothetical protein